MNRTISTLCGYIMVDIDHTARQMQYLVDIERIKEIKDGVIVLLKNAEPATGMRIDDMHCALTGLGSYIKRKRFLITNEGEKERYAHANITDADYIGYPKRDFHLFFIPLKSKALYSVKDIIYSMIHIVGPAGPKAKHLTTKSYFWTLSSCVSLSYKVERQNKGRLYMIVCHEWKATYYHIDSCLFKELYVEVLYGPLLDDFAIEETQQLSKTSWADDNDFFEPYDYFDISLGMSCL